MFHVNYAHTSPLHTENCHLSDALSLCVVWPVPPFLSEPISGQSRPDSQAGAMSEPSKLVKSWVTASCSEVFHPKTQHCGPHFSKIFRGVFWRSVQLYAPFFLVMRLLNGRNIFKLESLKSFVKSVLRGSLFLST